MNADKRGSDSESVPFFVFSARAPGRKGTALLVLVMTLVLVGVGLAIAMPRANHDVQRRNEARLRHVLGEFRRASRRFAERNGRPARTLDELVKDANGTRFLRRIYQDPVTRRPGWNVAPGSDRLEVRSMATSRAISGVPFSDFR